MVATQLGHAHSDMVVKVYGRFVPNLPEQDRWEATATRLDGERFGQLEWSCIVPFPVPTATQNPRSDKGKIRKIKRLNDFDNSWGGTRTLDPGIMREIPPPMKNDGSE